MPRPLEAISLLRPLKANFCAEAIRGDLFSQAQILAWAPADSEVDWAPLLDAWTAGLFYILKLPVSS